MTTHFHSALPGRLAAGVAVLVLLVAVCVPVATTGLTCRETTAAARASSARDLPAYGPDSTGVDLELRILHVRIEFPWLKTLPITPAHRIVISWMAGTED